MHLHTARCMRGCLADWLLVGFWFVCPMRMRAEEKKIIVEDSSERQRPVRPFRGKKKEVATMTVTLEDRLDIIEERQTDRCCRPGLPTRRHSRYAHCLPLLVKDSAVCHGHCFADKQKRIDRIVCLLLSSSHDTWNAHIHACSAGPACQVVSCLNLCKPSQISVSQQPSRRANRSLHSTVSHPRVFLHAHMFCFFCILYR
jgi:hypothetical protein